MFLCTCRNGYYLKFLKKQNLLMLNIFRYIHCVKTYITFNLDLIYLSSILLTLGVQWLSGRVLDSRPKGRGFEPHRHHCVVVLEQGTFILA